MHTSASWVPVAPFASSAAGGRWHPARLLSLFFGLALGLMLALGSSAARAEEDPPGRVGRIADFNGSVSWWDHEAGAWADAERNRPLTTGDRISTAASGRAELRVGSTALYLSNSTELEVLRLDDEKMVFQLHSGSLALRLRSRELADETEVLTDEARLLPQRAGYYRFDRDDDTSHAATWRGELRVADAERLIIGAGQRAELYREGRRSDGRLRSSFVAMPSDGFSTWAQAEDEREQRYEATAQVSPEMTGAEDLARYGSWETHPEYGLLWQPRVVVADWAPYRYGRWAWVRPWGWTWIDEAPWGFAPFHYGRWVNWRGRWGWVPGAYVPRPVYAPALVAWVGGGGWGISVQIGGPTVGWVPLAPREAYRPYYRSTPRYVERVNPTPPYRWRHPPNQVPTGPISYGNQGVPNGVTVVPSDVLVRRRPVARDVMEVPREGPRQPLTVLPAPPAPLGAGMVGPQRPPRSGPSPQRGPDREAGDGPDGREGREGREGRGGRDLSPPVQMVPGGAQPLPRPEPRPDLRPPRSERLPERADRPERPERAQRPERPERADRAERPDRPQRPEAALPADRVGPARPPAAAPAPQRPAEAERTGPPRPAPSPERAQIPGRERGPERNTERGPDRGPERDRERQSQR